MNLYAGLGGVARNACVTLCTDDGILGICEQERVTRVRAAGFNRTGLPDEALDELLRRSGRQRRDVSLYAVAEALSPAAALEPARLDHHFAHACSAFLPSPFERATIVICDHEAPHVSVWEGDGTSVTRVDWPWTGPGFADLLSGCAEVFGFVSAGREQRLEALARLNPGGRDERLEGLFVLDADRLHFQNGWQTRIRGRIGPGAPVDAAATVAGTLQAQIADLLVEFLALVKARLPGNTRLCVGGSLFYNSSINSRVKRGAGFDEVFVPINPGNAGLSIGTGFHASDHGRQPVTPFLGPSYSPEEIKGTLDNCKLRYQWASDAEAIAIAVDSLKHGRLVAWFDGPMEWGPRALGARSILANPFSPYVLENLNRFLKQREPWRGYALSGLDASVREHFDGPPASPYMECDFTPRDRIRFRHVLPGPRADVRVHTVGDAEPPRFRRLLQAFGEATGVPILVNTSFNGFSEPIVCSPRDAVRVFYGSGVDTLVLGEFVVTK
jgi:carbamoyltransferase